MRPIPVADPDDPRLALFRGVRDPELLRRHGLFLAEGRLVVERLLLQSHYAARSVLVTPAAHASLAPVLSSAACPVFLADPPLMRELAGFNLHRGCLALGERGLPRPAADVLAGASLLVMLERVANPDNMGGVFRSAAAFGASGVLLSPGCTDPLYRKSIRTSMGATLTMPCAVAGTWPDVLLEMTRNGWTIVALTPGPESVVIGEVAPGLSRDRVAIVAGHEGEGLGRDSLAFASVRARIPIAAGVDSLNLAMAVAVALYELTREGPRVRPGRRQPADGRPR